MGRVSSASRLTWRLAAVARPEALARDWRVAMSLLVALLGLALALWVSSAVFEGIPHNEDELAFEYQSKVFAGGALAGPAPPVPGAFFAPFVIDLAGKRFAKYPPGYPLLLAPGSALGVPWLVNPVLGALSLLLLSWIGARCFSAPAGLLAALLGATSPFFLEYAGSLMSHTATLCLVLGFLALFVVALEPGRGRAALAAGALAGFVFLARPATALGVLAPFALYALWLGQRGRGRDLMLPLALGALPGLLTLPLYNAVLTGQLRLSLYDLWWPFDRYGFGEGIGTLGRHTPAMGWYYVQLNLEQVAPTLLGWPLSGYAAFVLFVVEALWVAWQLRPGRGRLRPGRLVLEGLLILSVLTLIAAYVPYWAPHPRYYYEGLGGFLLVSALGALRLLSLLGGQRFGRLSVQLEPSGTEGSGAPLAAVRRDSDSLGGVSLVQLAVGAALAILLAVGLFTSTPGYLWTLHGKNFFTRARLDAVEAAGLKNALVLVVQERDWSDYGSVFPANSPWFDGDVVYAQYTDEATIARLRRAFPGRAFYLLRGTDLRPFG